MGMSGDYAGNLPKRVTDARPKTARVHHLRSTEARSSCEGVGVDLPQIEQDVVRSIDTPEMHATRVRRGRLLRRWGVALLLAVLGAAVAGGLVAFVPRAPRLPAPFGLAVPGDLVFDAGGDILRIGAHASGRVALTSGDAEDFAPYFSPLGTRVAFFRRAAGVLELVLTDPDGTHPQTIELPKGAEPSEPFTIPAWSPDASRIAVSLVVPPGDDPGIWIAEASTGGIARITDEGTWAADPSWSSNGSQIAFHGADGTDDNGVYVMAANGASPRRVSQAPGSGFAFHLPSWQPGGPLIAFYAGDDGVHDVFLVNADGTNELEVSHDANDDEFWPAWSPDGSLLAFERSVLRADHAEATMILAVDPRGRRVHAWDPVPIAESTSGVMVQPSVPVWSPDGKRIAVFVTSAADLELSIALLGVTDDVPKRTTAASAGGDAFLSWQRLAP